MKKLQNLGKRLSRNEMKNIQAGTGGNDCLCGCKKDDQCPTGRYCSPSITEECTQPNGTKCNGRACVV